MKIMIKQYIYIYIYIYIERERERERERMILFLVKLFGNVKVPVFILNHYQGNV